MELPSSKQLISLAKACRKAGITSFKGAGIEFTLSETTPPRVVNRRTKETAPPKDLGANTVESDELVGDALLFWSSEGTQESNEGSPQ